MRSIAKSKCSNRFVISREVGRFYKLSNEIFFDENIIFFLMWAFLVVSWQRKEPKKKIMMKCCKSLHSESLLILFYLQSGTIDLEEFIGGIALCLHGKVKDKCRLLFHIFNLVLICHTYYTVL